MEIKILNTSTKKVEIIDTAKVEFKENIKHLSGRDFTAEEIENFGFASRPVKEELKVEETKVETPKKPSLETLRAEASKLGVKYQANWGEEALKKHIAKAKLTKTGNTI